MTTTNTQKKKCKTCGKQFKNLALHKCKGKQTTTTKRNTTTNIKLTSETEGMNKPQEYLEFITFMALPRTLREEIIGADTQEDFSKKFKVSEKTLVDWKKRAGFWDDVVTVRKEFFKARTADVLLALETKNLSPEKVNGQDVRVLLTYTGEYSEKQELEHKVHPELQAALEKIGKVLD